MSAIHVAATTINKAARTGKLLRQVIRTLRQNKRPGRKAAIGVAVRV